MKHQPTHELLPFQTGREREAYRLGIRAAAEIAGTYDKQIDHLYKMEDVILYKFNLRKTKPRKKKAS